jgi:hypothetical protein
MRKQNGSGELNNVKFEKRLKIFWKYFAKLKAIVLPYPEG